MVMERYLADREGLSSNQNERFPNAGKTVRLRGHIDVGDEFVAILCHSTFLKCSSWGLLTTRHPAAPN